MLKAFFKDSVIYALPSFISRGISLFLVPLYTRVLSPSDYGSLDLLTVFAGLINLTISLEVSQGLARFYVTEQDPDRKVFYASTAFWFTMVCYTFFALLMLLNSQSLSVLIMGQEGVERAFMIGIAYIWINGMFYLIQNQFRWELKSKQYSIISLLMFFATAIISVWLVYGLRLGIEGLLLGLLFGTLFGFGMGLWFLRDTFRFCFNAAFLREMLAYSTPLMFSGVAVWISLYVDRIMIKHFLTIEEVGLYGIGYRLASISSLIMVGFQGALTPLVYTYHRDVDTPRQLAQIFRLFLVFAMFVFLVLSLFAHDILHLLTTENFYDASVVIVYLVPALLLANMYIFAPGISIAKKTSYVIWINTLGALINVGLNYCLIPIYGIEGAGLATMFGYLSIFSIYMVLSQRLYTVPHEWRLITFYVCIAIVMTWWVPQLQLEEVARLLVNILALAFFAVFTLVIGMVKLSELRKGIALLSIRLSLRL